MNSRGQFRIFLSRISAGARAFWNVLMRAKESWLLRQPKISTSSIESPNRIHCRHCFEEIDSRAKVCPKCRVHQTRIIGITLTYIPGILAIFAIVSVSFAVLQFYEARKKRIEAQDAASRAEKAEMKAREAEERTQQLAKQAEFDFIVIQALNDGRPAF